jgi:RNA polymerase sigma-70 factor, ECF subfamily
MQLHSFDQDYLRRLTEGDFRTQEHFVAYFSELIRLKLRTRVNSPSDVEDLRQETFARVFSALTKGSLRQPERLGAFVNSVCNNLLLEHYRSGSSGQYPEDTDFFDPAAEAEKILPARQTKERVTLEKPEAVAENEVEEAVLGILEELPERDRRLLRQVFLEEKDKDEVCRDLGVDREYLRILLYRAKKSFKSLYLKRTAAKSVAARVGTLKDRIV